MRPFFLAALLPLAFLAPGRVAGQSAPASPRYRLVELGQLGNRDVTELTGVTDGGLVAGYAYQHVPPGHLNSWTSVPFLWSKGKFQTLPTLGGEYGQALCLDADGNAGGYARRSGGASIPVVWRRATEYQAEAMDTRSGYVRALLPDGSTLGTISEKGEEYPVRWQAGPRPAMQRLSKESGAALGQGPDGTLFGWKSETVHGSAPLMYDFTAVQWRNGKRTNLPAPGVHSFCTAVNERGLATGWVRTREARRACVWRDGKLELLETPALHSSQAYAINQSGMVVGEHREPADHEGWRTLACMWRDGRRIDLESLLPADSGWELERACALSNTGLIAALGRRHGSTERFGRAVLLTPVRE